jgi:uncharacterized membrane protein
MLFGLVMMLVLAAIIEASISPSTLPNPVKWFLGIANLVAVVSYFTFSGRKSADSSQLDARGPSAVTA